MFNVVDVSVVDVVAFFMLLSLLFCRHIVLVIFVIVASVIVSVVVLVSIVVAVIFVVIVVTAVVTVVADVFNDILVKHFLHLSSLHGRNAIALLTDFYFMQAHQISEITSFSC